MNKIYILFTLLFILIADAAHSVTWEKLYVKRSTDCFRNVREVAAGGYILAGYTANLTPNDTDALVVRLNTNGDTLWTYKYNGPSSKADAFYKVFPTSDGGYVLCGYSASFGGGDNAFYVKLNSSGQMQWIKNWGGSGVEHAEDIIQLSDGSYAICGYTTTSPAHYYDAFILRVDANGNTLWSKIYGGTAYDDATSILSLPDGGFIFGGQSNSQYYLVRTNSTGDTLWTKAFGTSGIDKIEDINFSQGNDGYVLVGTTDGIGAGGEDAYLVKTDTGGVQQWAHTYGGTLNDGFHRIEWTTDGGYIASGTTSMGPWNNPNMWLVKMDASGVMQWQNYYGGNDHDHGYSGMQTSDGGYIISGHTHSFLSNANQEDAIVIKTNSSGVCSNELTWTTVSQLIAPVGATCGAANTQVQVQVKNQGVQTVTSIPVTIEITGAITQTLNQTVSQTVAPGTTKTLTFTTTVDMSGGGTFHFHCYTGNPHDLIIAQNYLDQDVTAGVSSQAPSVTDGTHCGPGVVSISASSPDPLKWYAASSGGSSIATGSNFTTPFITSNITYYVQAGTSCPSLRVPVNATITAGLADPTPADGSRCGTGTVLLSASSANTINWFSSATSSTSLNSGSTFTTPSLSSNNTYYIDAENLTCSSNRVAIHAIINSIPNNPVTTPGMHCMSGTVVLSATSSSTINWYDALSGGTLLFSGTTFTTPVISSTTTFYAQADNGTCTSNRVAANATIATTPADPVTTPNHRCGTGTVALTANASSPIKWFDAASGGSQVGTGSSFTTPSISSTTTYYAMADNGCQSNRIADIATVNPAPANPVMTPASRCGGGSVVLTATSSNTIIWYSTNSGGSQLGTGTTYSTPNISTTTTYYAQTTLGGCLSNRIAVAATINPVPADPVVISVSNCGNGSVTLTASSTDSLTWYNAASGGTQIRTGSTLTTPVISTTTVYYVQANNPNCTSNMIADSAVINPLPTVNLGPDTVYTGATSYLLDAGNGFTGYLWSTTDVSQTYTASATGNYCVTVTDNNNCSASDCEFVEFTLGVNNGIELNNFNLYPDPSSGIVTIEFSEMHSEQNLSVIDITGKTVYSKRVFASKETVDLSNLSRGIYVVKIGNEKLVMERRLVIE